MSYDTFPPGEKCRPDISIPIIIYVINIYNM